MVDELRSLIRAYPLPPGCSEPQLFSDVIEVGGVPIRRAGIQSTTPDGGEVTGSAAELESSPLPRAYFELLERAALIDAAARTCPIRDASGRRIGWRSPDPPPRADTRSRPARSNGVALHQSWDRACRRARYELAERDRVLGAWYGELPLVPVDVPSSLASFAGTHRWCARSIPASAGAHEADVEVAVIVGFPRDPDVPLARGFAGRGSLREALDAAAAEAVQTLAFIWDEPLPTEAPALSPTPMFHLDYYLWPGHHAQLREWLAGEWYVRARHRERARDEARFVDLTPPCFEGSLYVVRAVRRSARELVFGEPPPALARSLPSSRHVHPIP